MGLNEANIYNELRAMKKAQAEQHNELVQWLAAVHAELKRANDRVAVAAMPPPQV